MELLMQTVRHQGLAIALDHPALWIDKGVQIVRDLVDVLTHEDITLDCLRHLLGNRLRLIGGHYQQADGRGCLMFVLTERLAADCQIHCKQDLIRFFGRSHGRPGSWSYIAPQDSAEYQPAKWLVRLVDGQFCGQVRLRYGRSAEFFDYDLVLEVARQVLAQREAAEKTWRPAAAAAS
jgi:hypothetical protein